VTASNGARDAILGRIREALGDPMPAVAIPRDYERTLPEGTDIFELFVERVSDYRATVRRTTAAGLPATIAAVLSERGATRIAAPVGIPADWFAGSEVERVGDDPPLSFGDLDRLDGVVTGCAVAIAETGTIVLDGGPGCGRRALTLVPDHHVCVVRAEQVVAQVPDAIAALAPAAPLTFVSGPSATSDIELERVEGVHGPRRLDVVVVG
jgi:L-lactate dehydrogenase complex protein LldG